MTSEWLDDNHEWLRIADVAWDNPLDPSFAAVVGGRWNPPASFPVLYLNEDVVTARLNLRAFIANWPYGPEDLRDMAGPVLVSATLPRHQKVADVHTPGGVEAVGLPATYPHDLEGKVVPHEICQPIGMRIRAAELRGVRCRSARSPSRAERELAWFPATSRSVARLIATLSYVEWYWG